MCLCRKKWHIGFCIDPRLCEHVSMSQEMAHWFLYRSPLVRTCVYVARNGTLVSVSIPACANMCLCRTRWHIGFCIDPRLCEHVSMSHEMAHWFLYRSPLVRTCVYVA